MSARVELTPGAPPRTVLAVVPLLNLSLGAGMSPTAQFTVPTGASSTRIEYRATGHGEATDDSRACLGPAEEFCRRTHHVLLDGTALQDQLIPWREDCWSLCTLAS